MVIFFVFLTFKSLRFVVSMSDIMLDAEDIHDLC